MEPKSWAEMEEEREAEYARMEREEALADMAIDAYQQGDIQDYGAYGYAY